LLVGELVLGTRRSGEHAAGARGWREPLQLVGVACAAHFGALLLAQAVLNACGLAAGFGQTLDYAAAMTRFEALGPRVLLDTLIDEWLVAFAPLSVTFLAGLARRGAVSAALVLALSLPVYLLATFVVLGGVVERGAYLLPLASLAALATVRALPAAAVALVLAAGAVFGVVRVVEHDDGHVTEAMAASVAAVAGDREVLLLIESELDLETCLVRMPERQFFTVDMLAGNPPEQLAAASAGIEQALRQKLEQGVAVFLSRRAVAYLADRGSHELNLSGPELLTFFRERFHLVPLGEEGMLAFRVEPR
jgi:hypothetical protein